MVKDPRDNSPELDLSQTIPFPSSEINGEITPIENVEPEFKSTLTPEQIVAAEKELHGRSYGDRHPELGEMIKCNFCGRRHRKFELGKPCEQTFTYTVGGREDGGRNQYQQFREVVETDPEGVEGPNGEVPKKVSVVPNLRTALRPDAKPSIRQIVGAATFAKKRFHPHFSALAQRLVLLTRQIADARGVSLEADPATITKEESEQLQKDVRSAKLRAARILGKKLSISSREFKRRRLI